MSEEKCQFCGEEFDFIHESGRCNNCMDTELKIQSLTEAEIGQVYDQDDLFACSDWYKFSGDIGYASIRQGLCIRIEIDDILKDKVVVKEIFDNRAGTLSHEDMIDNFIIYWTSDDNERERMRKTLEVYMDEVVQND